MNDNTAIKHTPDIIFPAGRYYIGDLCYVMHDKWSEVCDLMFPYEVPFGCNGDFTAQLNGPDRPAIQFSVYSTACGDGYYPASNGAMLGVDAGVIGCICLSDITEHPENNVELGTVVEFDQPFTTGYVNGRYVMRFGHITVDTEGYDEEDN